MLNQPNNTKFKKTFKGRIKGNAKNGYKISFGTFGLKALQPYRINSKQIESARKAINGYLKRSGKLWIRIFPNVPITKKPIEVRMGSGKGNVVQWACKVKPGKIIFELDNISKIKAKEAFLRAAAKLPIKTRIINL